ncbi:DUF4266 domain-containing protein [Aquabacterium humicola]|uniref:DUF4266 domain-containing protein n=1 Tax=Aquabacterium humicola TaxID=3237377 RepID=UPI002543D25B|nr:DUF4266 domain-containing protein [Rubrivivax pictus]
MQGCPVARPRALLACLAWLLLAGGCTARLPQAWQKQHLARPEMAMDADALEQRNNLHVHGSKENSAGGQGVGGGGCGCN